MPRTLILGGTRLMGTHLVEKLLELGHDITIATRGRRGDGFGDKVKRLVLDRFDADSVKQALEGKSFDVVFDSLALSSNDVKVLLDVLACKRYIMISTMAVYSSRHALVKETEFKALEHPLKWMGSQDDTYAETKRQAECALFQQYSSFPSVAVRYPVVIGEDDYTKRLLYYVEHVMKGLPINPDKIESKMPFVTSKEAGQFLAHLADKEFTGPVNGSNVGWVSVQEIISYIEEKTGKEAVFSGEAEKAPFVYAADSSLDTSVAEGLGFVFQPLEKVLFPLIDRFIETVGKE
ncbi:NAD-dependent epimerase/dehydratase family protein [Clostridia bacterium OttesenSCG-928-F22]|nr:NAD-dependent epimerase/dehydratase family protein [Clostridia bacterium OttesenSCG-928-F22]